jgi:hypothetical protein
MSSLITIGLIGMAAVQTQEQLGNVRNDWMPRAAR